MGPYCQNTTPDVLPTTSDNGITGTWSPATINTATVGTSTYTFIPDAGQCGSQTTMDVVIDSEILPTFTQLGPYCQNTTPDVLPTTSDNGITGTWSPATINTATVGTSTYTFIPDAGQCGSQTTMDVVIDSEILPTFTQLGPYCQNTTPDVLPTTSDNGITGTWSPATINTATVGTSTYTFTPDAGQCGSQTTMDVVIDSEILPTFTQLGPYCQNTTPDVLPTTSNNGITGTWSPATINTATVGTSTYTFTPDAGQCSMQTTMNIVIDSEIIPVFTQLGPYCQNTTADILPVVSDNGINGAWDAAINTSVVGTTTYTFTPSDPSQCSTIATMDVVIDSEVIPTFATLGPYCENAPADVLPTTSIEGITGTWDGPINTSTTGTTTYNFTPDDPTQCGTTTTMQVTVDSEVTPTFTQLGPYCENAPADVLPTTSIEGITGIWDGPINTATVGTSTYTFTPDVGQCSTPMTMDIIVDSEVIPTFTQLGPYCENATPDVLATTSVEGVTGTWDGPINTATVGTSTYTFTPDVGQCGTIVTMDVTIDSEIIPTFASLGPYCQNTTPDVLPLISDNGINGVWDAAINTSIVGMTTYTFTPDDPNQCGIATIMDVEVVGEVLPTFDQLGPYCQDETPAVLPTASIEGITGTWDAAINTSASGTTTYTFTPDDISQCGLSTTMDIVVEDGAAPIFTQLGPYCLGVNAGSLPIVSENSIIGTWDPPTINTSVLGTSTYTFTPGDLTGCSVVTTMDITITDETLPTFAALGPYCEGDSPGVLLTTSIEGITGVWEPSVINTSITGTSTYTFTPDNPDQCGVETTMDILVKSGTTPSFTQLGPYCEGVVAEDLPDSSIEGITGTWSPLSINTALIGMTTYTFTPDDASQCGGEVTMNVMITEEVLPGFTQLGPFCQGSTAVQLPDVSTEGITGTWAPSSINTSSLGTTTYSFTPDDPAQCALPTSMDITIENEIIPTFAQIGPYCQGSPAGDLPTVSNEGITGSWDPSSINTNFLGTSTYTFSPDDPNQCGTETNITVTIETDIVPTFTELGPYCEGSTVSDVLPATSIEGITGTWDPPVISTANSGIQTHTFTPDDPAQCGLETTMNIQIDFKTIPVFSQLGPYCEGETSGSLPKQANGITGNWSPPFINTDNVGTTLYTFTPDSEQCSEQVTMEVEVFGEPDVSISAPTEACADGTTSITISFDGNVSNINTAIFDWDFDGGTATSTGNESYNVIFNDIGTGTATISLDVTENGCPGQGATTLITLYEPLPMPEVTCTATLTSISFDWNDIPGVTEYEVTVTMPDGSTKTETVTESQYEETGLTNGDEVSISVMAIGTNLCGNSDASVTSTCNISECPPDNPIVLGVLADDFCADASGINLSGTPSGLIFSGDGVTGNTLDPSTLNPGGPYTLTASYTDENGCDYETTHQFMVYGIPSADFTALPESICEGEVVTVTYTGTANITNAIFAWDFGTATTSALGNEEYELTYEGTGNFEISLTVTENNCVSDPVTQTVNVIAGADASWTPTSLCASDNPITLSPEATSTQGGVWTGQGITDNGNGTAEFNPAGLSGSITVTYTVGDVNCQDSNTQNIEVVNSADASWTGQTVCEADGILILTPEATSTQGGVWTGEGITDKGDGTASFDPTGLSGAISVTYTAGSIDCQDSESNDIVVVSSPVADWTPTSLCASDNPITLSPDATSTQGGVWTGQGITDNGDGTAGFNPSGLSGSIAITYTVGDVNCQASSTQDIIIVSSADAAWTTTTVCEADGVITLIPDATSTQGGVWTGNGITDNEDGTASFDPTGLSGAISVTYTAGSVDCQSSSTQDITVTSTPIADWTTPQTICEADGLITLSPDATSTQNGTWTGQGVTDNNDGTAEFNPSGLSGAISVTYTVGSPSCQAVSTEDITVIEQSDPSWTSQTICESDGIITLSPDATSTQGGSWTGQGIIDNNDGTAEFNPNGLSGAISVTYTVGSATCEESSTENMTVISTPVAAWTTTSVCADDGTILLSPDATSTQGGVWTGQGVTDNNDGTAAFNPSGLSGNISITYTVGTVPCTASVSQDVEVLANPDPAWTTTAVCEANGIIILSPDATSSQNGTWTGSGISDNSDGTAEFNPVGLSGNVSVTYTVGNGVCEESSTQDIAVTGDVDAEWTAQTLCSEDDVITLVPDATSTQGGTWTGQGVTDNGDGTAEFNPSGLSGNISVTYTVGSVPCEESVEEDMIVHVNPIADFSLSEPEICADGTSEVTLTFTGSYTDINNVTFTWDFGMATVVSGSGEGPYTLTWSDLQGNIQALDEISLVMEENTCPSDEFIQTIDVYEPLETPVIICEDATLNEITFSWEEVAGSEGYEVTVTSDAPPTVETVTDNSYTVTGINPSSSVTITVMALNSNICGDSEVSVEQECFTLDCPDVPVVITGLDDTYCDYDAVISLTAEPTGGTFSLNGETITELSPQDLGAGVYEIAYSYTDEYGCPGDTIQQIEIIGLPDAEFIAPEDACLGDVLQLELLSPDVDATYSWDLGEFGTSDVMQPQGITFSETGVYSFSVTVSKGECVNTYNTEVNVSDVEIEDMEDDIVKQGFPYELYVEASSALNGDLTYEWEIIAGESEISCIDCPDPTVIPNTLTVYQVTVTDEYGCSEVTDVTIDIIYDYKIIVPTAFSPNNDGVNDYLTVTGRNIAEFQLYIYNRWGEQIAIVTENDEGWNGTFKGIDQEIGVYVWYVEVIYESGESGKAQGNTTIVR